VEHLQRKAEKGVHQMRNTESWNRGISTARRYFYRRWQSCQCFTFIAFSGVAIGCASRAVHAGPSL